MPTTSLQKKADKLTRELAKLYPNPKVPLKYSSPWELLVAVILSARNTDKKVNEVTSTLFKKYKKLEDYKNASLEEFTNDIAQIGLRHQKAKAIINSAKIVSQKFQGKVPDTIDDLTSLPGVGRKTANVILSEIFQPEGIVVDTHVTRLAKEFGLTKNTNPEKIEQDLMKLIPKNKWRNFPLQLIYYGREHHKARSTKPHPLEKYT